MANASTAGNELVQTLAAVRGLLMDPSAGNLDQAVPALRLAVDRLREVNAVARPAELSRLVLQIRLLHEQAGRIRFGVARLSNAEAAGYTRDGALNTTPSAPHMEISG